MTRKEKQSLIRRAYEYNAKARAMASCNQAYMGSMAIAMLFQNLGAEIGASFDAALNGASDEQLDAGLKGCEGILKVAGVPMITGEI